ncbi:MAG: FAD-dependent oxidoreductase, partial [Acidobacteria bacterium]|nr:FAD-dependent oxidoreductase [Acidobacteriota bacterium]
MISVNSAAAHVTVVGGGLAGMSAAVALAPRGYRVTLIEKRPALGGRAGSLLDAASGEWIDNCQHILMPCCTNLLDFYRKIGVERRIRFHPEIPFLDSRGRLSRLYSSPLPAPLHCLPSFFALRFLSLRDKWRIAAGLRALRHLAEADESDGRSFLEWLRGKGQSARALAEFWQPVIVSALNEEPARVSAALAAKVFLEAFLSHPKGWWMGIPTVPLGLLYQEPAAGFLRSCGSEVLLRSDVLAVERLDGNRWAVQLRDGPRIDSDKIVLAVPWHALPPLLSGSVRISMMLPPVENLKASPITGVHVWFD